MAPVSQFRRAGPEDVVAIARMLREFYSKAGAAYGIPYDHESTLNTVSKVITGGLCLVGKNSVAGAVLVPYLYNANVVVAYVPFWYFRTPREIQILEALMRECRESGAQFVNVASHPPHHRIGRFYQRLGMVQVETQWHGDLNNACKGEESR